MTDTTSGLKCAECGAENEVAARRAARLEARVSRLEDELGLAQEIVDSMLLSVGLETTSPRLDVVKDGDDG